MCQRSRKAAWKEVKFDLQCLPVWGLASCTSVPWLVLLQVSDSSWRRQRSWQCLVKNEWDPEDSEGVRKGKTPWCPRFLLKGQAHCELLHRKELPRTRSTQELKQKILPFPWPRLPWLPHECSGCCLCGSSAIATVQGMWLGEAKTTLCIYNGYGTEQTSNLKIHVFHKTLPAEVLFSIFWSHILNILVSQNIIFSS